MHVPALLILGLLILTGCNTTTHTTVAQDTPDGIRTNDDPRSSHDVLFKDNRELEVQVFGSGAEVVMMIATIHGDESAGTPLLHRLASHLNANPDLLNGVQLVLVPVANPDGFDRNRRTNSQGVDLNRNFPTSNFSSRSRNGDSPLSQWESRALHDLILHWKPNRVVSIHQPLRCIDYDGSAKSLAEEMAVASGLPVRKLGALPGSLGTLLGVDLGIPIVTVELPGSATRYSQQKLWDRYGEMLLVAIRVSGPSDGP